MTKGTQAAGGPDDTSAPPVLKDALLDAAVELLSESRQEGQVRVNGRSMVPTLQPGAALLARFGAERPQTGDLLLFRQVDYLVVHRLLGATRTPDGQPGWRTRGDGKIDLDAVVEPYRVVGSIRAAQQPDGQWYDLERPLARLWARAVVLHAFFWSGLAWLLGPLDRLLGLGGFRQPMRRMLARVDRGTLTLAHLLLFKGLHRKVELGESAAESPRDEL